MAKKSRKGNKRQTSSKTENVTKSQSFEYSGSEVDASQSVTQSMQNPIIASPKSSSPRKDQANASPKAKPPSPKKADSPRNESSPRGSSPKAEVLASPFLSPSGIAAAASAPGKSPQTVEFVISPMTTEAGNVQRAGSNSERVTPDTYAAVVKSPKGLSPKASPKADSPTVRSPIQSPKVASPSNQSPKPPSPRLGANRSPKANPENDPLRDSVDMAALSSPRKSPKSKQTSPSATAGPVAISSDGAVTVTIEAESVDSPRSRTSPKSQKSTASDSIPMFAAYPTSPGTAAIPILELAEGAKSSSRVASPAAAAAATSVSPRVAELQAKLASPSAASPKLPTSNVSSRKTSPNPSQLTSPKVSDLPPINPGTPKIDLAAVASPKVDVLTASPKMVASLSPKIATPIVATSPTSASRVANISAFVEGTPESLYPSPGRATAVDSVVVQQVTEGVVSVDSATFHSAIQSSPKQAVPMSVLSATAMMSTSMASPEKQKSRPASPPSFIPTSFEEAMSHVAGTSGRSMRLPDNLAPLAPRKLTPFENIMAVLTCKACLGAPAMRLAQELEQDRDVETILSNTPYNSQVEIHRKIMQTIWSFFFGQSNIDRLEMVGDHWGKLGFQAVDPSVEINRSIPGGVLNLLHILFLIENHASDARKWLNNEKLPFAGVSISMSSLALEKGSRGTLNAQYNSERMVTPVTAHFYVGLMRRAFEHSGECTLEETKAKLRKEIDVDVSDFFTSRHAHRQAGMSS